ncbi:hypothetical protein CHS0354_006809 [Potamilus streckersoni]|uniref:Uncharacterized protein n=1 Tax=Potamilus streckersoni TaxID=2493646 RepID=A0AAE0TFI6_9BIVA|nr:hypothetical protein CHS0354_006809 [Potamilus streckersoni]
MANYALTAMERALTGMFGKKYPETAELLKELREAEAEGRMSYAVSRELKIMPEGKEKEQFRTKIEEAVFYGTRAIAGKEGNFTEIQDYPEAE